MKYTKKFMVVPFEEETETELILKKEKNNDKKLTEILASNEPNTYNKYNETFKKNIYQKDEKHSEKKQKEFEKELENITGIIMDILENKKVNDDDYYKPIFTQTRSKKEKKSPTKKNSTIKINSPIKKKSPVKRIVKKEKKTKKVETSEEPIENTLNTGVSEVLDPERFNQLENVIKTQIKNEQESILTDDIDSDETNKSIRKKIIKTQPLAPKKAVKTRESLDKKRQIDTKQNKQNNKDTKTKWDFLT